MKKKTMLLLFISSTLAAVYNPYEDASSHDHLKLFIEFRSFVLDNVRANIRATGKGKVRLPRNTTSCNDKCGKERSYTFYCHCDVNCQLTHDCCADYLKTCKPDTTIAQEEREKWQCVNELHHQHLKYLPWYDEPADKLPRIRGHMMISSCLDCSPELKENCSNPDREVDAGKIPVEGSDGHTYKNKFCALGNGITSMRRWTYELFCTLNTTENTSEILNTCMNNQSCLSNEGELLRKTCTWYYAPPLNVTKNHTVCSPVKTCPQTPAINMTASEYSVLRLKCQAYMRVIFHNGSFYKNFHCALCHGIEPTEIQNPPTISYKVPLLSIFFEIPQHKPQRPNHKPSIENRYNNANLTHVNTTGSNESNATEKAETTEFMLEMYFNLIGLSVSMVTLLFLLVLYSLVKALRTTPGKIIIGLSSSVLAYQIVLLVSPQFYERAVACSITAGVLHFAILSSFSWMSVMSFDVWKTFGKNNEQPIAKKSSSFLYYSLFVFFNPLIIVLISVALDRSGVMLVYWRDGASRSCWIVDNLPNILFFKLPVGICLALNVIAFIWTIVGITNVRNKTKKYNSTKNKNVISKNLKMYGKLSVVMGLTWILGFCMEYNVILRFIYLIVNSLQGFFIFLAFVTNKRVVEKCKMSRPSWSQSQGSWLNTRKTSSGSTI